MKWSAKASQSPRARTTGVVYLLYFLTAIFAEFLNGRKFVILSGAANFIAYGFYIILALLFYYMFKRVNRQISLLAALFAILGCAIGALSLISRAMSNISPLIFFGPYCILIGYLIFRSAFLPRILGLLMLFAGLGWLAFLLPLANHLSTYIEVLGILAEASLMLWLLIVGVNVQRWKEQARAVGIKIQDRGIYE